MPVSAVAVDSGRIACVDRPGQPAGDSGPWIHAHGDARMLLVGARAADGSCTLGASRRPGLCLHPGSMGHLQAGGARRGARAAESDSLLMS